MNLSSRLSRVQLTLGGVGLVVGLVGLVQARHVAFRADTGVVLGWPDYELRLMGVNQFGALLILVLAGVGLLAGLVHRPVLAWLSSAGFALLAVQVLLQWRETGTNLVASVGSNLGFALMMAIGFAVTSGLVGRAAEFDEAQPVID